MILFLSNADTDLLTLHHALASLPPGFPPIRAANPSDLAERGEAEAFLARNLPGARLVVVRLLAGQRAFPDGLARLAAACREKGVPLVALPGTQDVDLDLFTLSTVDEAVLHRTLAYLGHGGVANLRELLLFLSDTLLGTAFGCQPPRPLPQHGLYHPRFGGGVDLSRYLAEAVHPGRPTVGLLFYRAHWLSGNLAFVDALIQALEARGANVLPVFCYTLSAEVLERYFVEPETGRARVDVLLSTLSFALHRPGAVSQGGEPPGGDGLTSDGPAGVDLFSRLDVPVLQAMVSTGPARAWEAGEIGLGPVDTAISVTLPEFDGRVITVPVSFKEEVTGEFRQEGPEPPAPPAAGGGGFSVRRYVPRPDRVEFVARLALNWAALRRKPNAAKRVAILLTNYPSRNARIGNAVGLDTPASVVRILQALARAGYRVEPLPTSGDSLIQAIVERCSNDREFVTEEQLQGAVGHVPRETYAAWFAALPHRARQELRETWGEPPGEAFVTADGRLAIPGILLGNVYVGLQPARGYGENPVAVYHSPDLVPTHHYLACYRWLREVFRADAVIHVGKHGTLEWLPGKGIGLSAACYPEVVLGDLPHFYPYIVNNPGEGTAAKRRSHAVLVDHLIPPMTTADTYDDLARLEQLLDEYYRVQTMDPAKLPILQRQIWEVVRRARLDTDLGVDAPPAAPDSFASFLQEVDGYLCELKAAQIREGLHVLGEAPRGESLVGLLAAILRLPNGGLPALPEALARALGLGASYHDLQEDPGAPFTGAIPEPLARALPGRALRVRGEVAEALYELGRRLLAGLAGPAAPLRPFDPAAVPAVVRAHLGRPAAEVEAVLRFVTDRLYPDLARTPAEIDNLLAGLAGRYVPPGPSGSPTRGMANVLPTGRNFYSVDPRTLPSPAAWEVGCRAAEALLAKYRAEEGRYPEAVGIVVWGTSTMRTQGDDVAEILYLLGVRPVWQAESRRVTGLEVIPLAELGRPRIDVTVRISGFFRDAFPHLVALLDQAVEQVAALAGEPDDWNYVRRHVRAAQAAREAAGLPPTEARRRALYRIFGSKPGAYGAGLLPAIHAGNWRTVDDLARIYIEWGAYAYGRAVAGERAVEEFVERFRQVSVAVKNQDNREHDIFDSDDYFQYHGGMIATIRALTGRSPRQYFGDTANPARVRVRDLADEARRVFRTRVVNPKWIRSVMRHGYKGASELAATVEYLFGYDATAGVVEGWMYQQLAEAYLFDETVRGFLAEKNPWALRDMAARLLEAIERGLWEEPPPDTRRRLEQALLSAEGDIEGRAGGRGAGAGETERRP